MSFKDIALYYHEIGDFSRISCQNCPHMYHSNHTPNLWCPIAKSDPIPRVIYPVTPALKASVLPGISNFANILCTPSAAMLQRQYSTAIPAPNISVQ